VLLCAGVSPRTGPPPPALPFPATALPTVDTQGGLPPRRGQPTPRPPPRQAVRARLRALPRRAAPRARGGALRPTHLRRPGLPRRRARAVRPAPHCTPVLTGHAASLAPYHSDALRPSPCTIRTRCVPRPVPFGRAASVLDPQASSCARGSHGAEAALLSAAASSRRRRASWRSWAPRGRGRRTCGSRCCSGRARSSLARRAWSTSSSRFASLYDDSITSLI
jgi:hypothetical protein